MKNIFVQHPNTNKTIKKDYHPVSLEDLINLEDSICDTIDINNSLDYLKFDNRNAILQKIIKKLRYGGKLILNGIDFFALCRQHYDGEIDIRQVSNVLNGTMSTDNLNNVIKNIQSSNIDINIAKIDGFNYFLEAKRAKYNE